MNQQVCAWCEQEFGVKVQDSQTSHGICARHAQEQLDQMEDMMKRANIDQNVIDNRLERIEQQAGAPDMAKDGIPSNAVSV